jgi:hypothetical protein
MPLQEKLMLYKIHRSYNKLLPLNEVTVDGTKEGCFQLQMIFYPATSNQKQGFPASETIQACGIFQRVQFSHRSAERGA